MCELPLTILIHMKSREANNLLPFLSSCTCKLTPILWQQWNGPRASSTELMSFLPGNLDENHYIGGELDSPHPTCNSWVSLPCTSWLCLPGLRKRRSSLAPAAMWVARESSCVLRTGDAQAAHSRKTRDETGRALRLPGHEALKRNPCCLCAVTGSTTRLGGSSSNTDDVQKIQSCIPEQPQMALGVTRGFKLLFSWTAAISLYREQAVMDMAFMSECLLTFLPSPPSFNCHRKKSLLLLFKYSHYGFGSSLPLPRAPCYIFLERVLSLQKPLAHNS